MKSLEFFAPRPAAPLIDPEAIWTANLRDEISPRGVLGLFRRINFRPAHVEQPHG
jgi:hypothetical protein